MVSLKIIISEGCLNNWAHSMEESAIDFKNLWRDIQFRKLDLEKANF